MRPIREILNDTLTYIGYLERFAQEGEQAFFSDIKLQLAVRQAYEVLGDLVKNLPDVLLATQPQIEWRRLKGMRDVIAHQYFQLDLDIVWDSTANLPELRAAVEAMLESLPEDDAS